MVNFSNFSKNAIERGDRILIIDDWIETGAQVRAAISLLENLDGKVEGVSVLAADKNPGTDMLFENYNLHCLRRN